MLWDWGTPPASVMKVLSVSAFLVFVALGVVKYVEGASFKRRCLRLCSFPGDTVTSAWNPLGITCYIRTLELDISLRESICFWSGYAEYHRQLRALRIFFES